MLGQEDQLMLIKGKRTKRARPASPLPLPFSNCDDLSVIATSSSSTTTTEEEEYMAHCLILLAQGPTKFPKPDYVYECKTCNRCFPSFQALGGHRASHRRPKSPPAEIPAPENQEPSEIIKNEELGLSLHIASADVIVANKPSKVHACAICGAEFSSGQALGGHMRRHRPIGSPAAKAVIAPAPARNLLCLDLNLPAEEQEDQQQQESSKFMFTSEKTLVFASSLVDCRY